MMRRARTTPTATAALATLAIACAPEVQPEAPATSTATAALAAHNGMGFNGRAFNGRAFNGMSFNGRAFNGRAFNGMGFNGRAFNGSTLNGRSFNGRTFNDAELVGVVIEAHQSELTLTNQARRARYRLEQLGGGVELSATDPATGEELRVRIEGPQAVQPIGGAIRKPVLSYLLTFFDASTGSWAPGLADADGHPLWAIPLNGYWNIAPGDIGTAQGGAWVDDPDAITFAARGFVLAKCVELGYRAWEPQLRDLHQTCVRALRADYCGDGRTFTRDHTLVDIYDVHGVQARETGPAPGAPERVWVPEAEWTTAGASCLAAERIQDWAPGEAPTPTCFGVPLAARYRASCALPISTANRAQWADTLMRTEHLGWSFPSQE